MAKSTVTKKTNTLKPEKQAKDKEKDHPEGEKSSDDKNPVVLPVRLNEQMPFRETVSSERTRSKEIPAKYLEEKPETVAHICVRISASAH